MLTSTIQDRGSRRGLLINITGSGRGKTTSSLGSALRALGQGWRVTMIQFVKDSRPTGEQRFSRETPMPFEILSMGMGFSWDGKVAREEHVQAASKAWETACGYLNDDVTDLLILDELNVALHLKWLHTADVLPPLLSRPAWKHVIISGRNAPEKLIAASDMVSEIKEIRHPFQSGVEAQAGIEY